MLRTFSNRTGIFGGTLHTGIGVGDIIGTVTECGEDESDCSDRKDPIIFGGECGRHLESKIPEIQIREDRVSTERAADYKWQLSSIYMST